MLVEKIKLEKDERVLKIIRKHWFILFSKTIGVVFVIVLPVLLLLGVSLIGSAVGMPLLSGLENYGAHLTFGLAFWILLNWIALFHMWTDYYLDVWVLTNRRLVTIDQRGLFHRVIGSFRLERLQDLNIEIKGIVATAFNYGSIEAQTAGGSEDEFKTTGLPDPRSLKSLIVATADALEQQHRNESVHATSTDL